MTNDKFGRERVFGHRAHALQEQRRVDSLLARDREYRSQEAARSSAELEVREGLYVNLAETAIGPTPEQFAEGERTGRTYRRFTPRQPNGTVRNVVAYRRMEIPQAHQMLKSRIIDYDGFRACLWYRNIFEATGLLGNIASTDYMREVYSSPANNVMFSDLHLEAQQIYRFIRQRIGRHELRLLDAMILDDVPIYRAGRVVGAGWRRARGIFAKAVGQLLVAREMASS